MATLWAGFFLILMGVFRIGNIIKFVPYPVTIGFTSGLALVLFVGQIKDFLGLHVPSFPADFFGRLSYYFHNFLSLNPFSLILGVITIFIVIFWPRITKKIPGSLIAIFFCTLVVYLFHIPTETVNDRFGQISSHLPSFYIPKMSFSFLIEMISPGISIALLAGMESLLSAVVADGMKGTKHRSDAELVGIGIGNIFSVFFFGIPATGAIARTATNIKNGAETPISAIITTIVLSLSLLFLGKWIAMIPMATLAGILVVVAYNMSECQHFAKLFKSPKYDIIVLVTTFLLTVFLGLITAIQIGVVLAIFLFVHSMAQLMQGKFLKEALTEENDNPLAELSLESVPEEIEIFEIQGPFFFAAVEKFTMAMHRISRTPKVLILRMPHVSIIDVSGLRALEDVFHRSQKQKATLFLSEVPQNVFILFRKTGFVKLLGENHIFPSLADAMKKAMKMLSIEKEPIHIPKMNEELMK